MNTWLQFAFLTLLTGNPVLAAAIVLALWLVVDHFTLGLFARPTRFVRRLFRIARLQRELENNPHDRRARLELGDLYVTHGRYARAVELLRPNLEAGDDDPGTLFTLGLACLGAGHAEQGERLLAHAREADPGFRHGAIDLELGRFRLLRGDASGAKAALARRGALRQGTVEGRVLLSRALEALGDTAGAALARAEAWREYRTAPRFQRRMERLWAWRARPSRPLLYVATAALCLVLIVRLASPRIAATPDPHAGSIEAAAEGD